MREDLQETNKQTKNGAPRLMEGRLSWRSTARTHFPSSRTRASSPARESLEGSLAPKHSSWESGGRIPPPSPPPRVLSLPTAGGPLRALREPPRP